MRKAFKLTEVGRKRRDELLREINIDSNKVRSVTLEFTPGDNVFLIVETLDFPGDDANELLALVVRSSEVGDE